MSDNYKHNLQFELRKMLTMEQELKPVHQQAEENMVRSEEIYAIKESELKIADEQRKTDKETFRCIHGKFCEIRQRRGEIEEELFSTFEDMDKWVH